MLMELKTESQCAFKNKNWGREVNMTIWLNISKMTESASWGNPDTN